VFRIALHRRKELAGERSLGAWDRAPNNLEPKWLRKWKTIYEIPYMKWKIIQMFETTNQPCLMNLNLY
jgi:hypothetical protein